LPPSCYWLRSFRRARAPRSHPRRSIASDTSQRGGSVEESFRNALQQLGYTEGQNLVIVGRFAERKADRLPGLAAELVRENVDVIVTITTPAALAAKAATTAIPIVMAGSDQPVMRGLIASLARPGGNVTGVTNNPGPEFNGKQQLLREAAPKILRVALIWDSSNPAEAREFTDWSPIVRSLGLTPVSADVRAPDEYPAAFATILRERAHALHVTPSALNIRHAKPIVDFALANRLPSMFGDRDFVDAGGLMSYWTSWGDLRRKAALYVDKILHGRKPEDLPVENPDKFQLFINLRTAKAIGLTIPSSVLARADEAIE
jgi:putative tryptophan/tyrosine transport system substrate-binding protein